MDRRGANPRTAPRFLQLNYRHHFHAGNFADLIKHAIWLELLRSAGAGTPRLILDTHAGAGAYDLTGPMAKRSGEAEAGIGRLMAEDAPPVLLERLQSCVRAFNPGGQLVFYPGSPVLTAAQMGPLDRLVAYELRPEDARSLQDALQMRAPARAGGQAQARAADGYEHDFAADAPGRGVVCLVDAPFETGRDAERIHTFTRRCLEARPEAALAVWAPLKDLESYDQLLRGVEAMRGRAPLDLVSAEVRLRSLSDPLRMNGCGMILINAPLDQGPLEDACRWIVGTCGAADGRAVIRRL